MKKVTGWMISNLLTVLAICLVIASFAGLWFVYSSSTQLAKDAKVRVNKINSIKNMGRQTVSFPTNNPDMPMEDRTITVNATAVKRVREVRQQMNWERDEIVKLSREINRSNHQVMLDGLFPEPRNSSLAIDAREAYRDAFRDMMGQYTTDALGPRLNAGMPPDFMMISETLQNVEREFLKGFNVVAAKDLDAKQQQKLLENKQKTLLDIMQRHARRIHIYAVTDITNVKEFPFEVGQWSLQSTTPVGSELWKGQMELWIQQDIANAIALTNQVMNPRVNVMTAPVKRLISIEVLEGYIGINDNRGGILQGDEDFKDESAGRRITGGPSDDAGMDVMYIPPEAMMGQGNTEFAPVPDMFGGSSKKKEEEDFLNLDGDQPTETDKVKTEDRFFYSPTGRASNDLYDVWHARVKLVVDFRRLPQLFDNLKNVNFMTVIKMNIRDVDEYQALGEGYVYGSDDVVEVDMIIESLWLRDWTSRYMPRKVKEDLGIDDNG